MIGQTFVIFTYPEYYSLHHVMGFQSAESRDISNLKIPEDASSFQFATVDKEPEMKWQKIDPKYMMPKMPKSEAENYMDQLGDFSPVYHLVEPKTIIRLASVIKRKETPRTKRLLELFEVFGADMRYQKKGQKAWSWLSFSHSKNEILLDSKTLKQIWPVLASPNPALANAPTIGV